MHLKLGRGGGGGRVTLRCVLKPQIFFGGEGGDGGVGWGGGTLRRVT